MKYPWGFLHNTTRHFFVLEKWHAVVHMFKLAIGMSNKVVGRIICESDNYFRLLFH
jgi:hypothetical protein